MLGVAHAATLTLAARNVLRQRTRSAFAILAIVTGVAALILSGGFVEDMFVQLGEWVIHSQTGHLQVSPTGFVERGARKPAEYLIQKPDHLKDRIGRHRDVAAVMARVGFAALLNNGRTDLAVSGEGVEPPLEANLATHMLIVDGRQLRGDDLASGVIGEGVAHALQIGPGDRVTLLGNTVAGAANTLDIEIVGVFRTFSKEYDARTIRVPLRAAQDLLDTSAANMLVVSLKDTAATATVGQGLRAELAGMGLDVHAWQELSDFHRKTVDLYNRQFGVLRLIVLVMVLLSVANTMNMNIFERVGELGTMRALGNKSNSLFVLLLSEAALLASAGVGLGVALGAVGGWAISAVGISMPPPPNSNVGYVAQIRIVPDVVAGAAAVGFGATVLAAVVPAIRAVRTPIAEALRQDI